MTIELIIPETESGAEYWAKMTGEPFAPPKAYYVVDDNEYWQIFFGIAYPEGDDPGAVVSVAVRKELDAPDLVVRDVVTKRDIMSLYQAGDEIRQQYYVKGGKIGKVWYGEPGRFDELRAEFNKPFRKDAKDRIHQVVIGGPDGEETVDSGIKYMTTLLDLARTDRIKFTPSCEALQSEVIKAVSDSSGSSISAYPPMVMALGFACRAIMVQRPWLQKMPKYEPPKGKNDWARGKSPWKRYKKRRKDSGMFGEGGKWI